MLLLLLYIIIVNVILIVAIVIVLVIIYTGEYICKAYPLAYHNYFPWEYSILGAAGLATGVTRAISTAVIVYELTGQPHLRLPLGIVVMTAYFVGNRFSKMVYEVLIGK